MTSERRLYFSCGGYESESLEEIIRHRRKNPRVAGVKRRDHTWKKKPVLNAVTQHTFAKRR